MEPFMYCVRHHRQPHYQSLYAHEAQQRPVYARPLIAAPPPLLPQCPRPQPAPIVSRGRSRLRSSGRVAKKVRASKSNVPGLSRYWTPSEHKLFVEALLRYGPKNLKEIAAHVGTRNMIQCRTHEQKCFMRLMREAQKETAKRAGAPLPPAKAKDVYSVSSSCGITLLCVVSEEMTRALQS